MTTLDADQRQIWDLAHPRVIECSDDQTFEQARRFAVESYKHACWFDGVDPTADDVIRGEIERSAGEPAATSS